MSSSIQPNTWFILCLDPDNDIEVTEEPEDLTLEQGSDSEKDDSTINKRKLKKLKRTLEEKKDVNPQRVRVSSWNFQII